MNMKLLVLLSLSFVPICLALSFQRPLKVQEQVKKLSWDTSNCIPNNASAGNGLICIQQVFEPIVDNDIRGLNQYCGYVSFGRTDLFFWLVLGSKEPKERPLVLWMNGGPGVSSLLGAFDQWGPRLFYHNENYQTPVKFVDNPDTVTENMNWIFLEQPAGVGYSKGPSKIKDSMEAADDVLKFLSIILHQATFKYNGKAVSLEQSPLHIAGESFAGHYIPAIASKIVENRIVGELNLKSIFFGNGVVDMKLIGPELYSLACVSSDPPWKTLRASPRLRQRCLDQPARMVRCDEAIELCRKPSVLKHCDKVKAACDESWAWDWGKELDTNPYDADQPYTTWQYSRGYYSGALSEFFNVNARKISLGVDPGVAWSWMNTEMNEKDFRSSGDFYRSYIPQIETILNAGIDIMLYAVSTLFHIQDTQASLQFA
jgi:cathepsin A (carboxypeptidase C)